MPNIKSKVNINRARGMRERYLLNLYNEYMTVDYELIFEIEKQSFENKRYFYYWVDKGYIERSEVGTHNCRYRLSDKGIDYAENRFIEIDEALKNEEVKQDEDSK